MTEYALLNTIARISGNDDLDIVKYYSDLAKSIILDRLCPFRESDMDVPDRYKMKQAEIAVYLIDKDGAEGEVSHSENGVSRSYESASVPESMLKGIMPYAKIFKFT